MFPLAQPETDIGNKNALILRALEDAVPVRISTLRYIINMLFPFNVQGFHPDNQIFNFNPVGPDVLHRTGSHLSGDQWKILHAVPMPLHAIVHEVVPDHTCPHTHNNIVIRFGHNLYAPDAWMQDSTFVVFSKQ